jgi:hypothetical protein
MADLLSDKFVTLFPDLDSGDLLQMIRVDVTYENDSGVMTLSESV